MLRLSAPLRKIRLQLSTRWLTQTSDPALTQGEKNLEDTLKLKFPGATAVEVRDISGGCGAMYEVFIESTDFKGKSIVNQHKQVNQALADDIKKMHGLRITTAVPKTPAS